MPRRITGSMFVTLDGVIQAPGGPQEDTTGGFTEGGWVFRMADEGIADTLGEIFSREFDLLLGRRTYEIFAAYWPYVAGDAIGEAFNRAGKYVLTRGGHALGWQNTTAIPDVEAIAALKAQDGPDLLIQGSSTLYPQLVAAGLLDELTLIRFPIVVGSGKQLFGERTPAQCWNVTEHKVTPKGTIIATYRPEGPPPPYPANAPAPSTSERERDRQKQMQAGTW